MMRINKFLASCGVASRRKCEEIILAGKVKINGKVVKELATDIDLDFDRVTVDGNAVHIPLECVYYKLHKPKGYVCTAKDDKERKTVISLMRGVKKRIYPIGRLDYDTEGLLILTDDGELTNIITHPKNQIDKVYIVKIEGVINASEIERLQKGVDIGGYTTDKSKVVVLDGDDKTTRLEVTIHEGKNRQVRKMFEAIEKNVIFLKRVQVGEIKLGGLARGEYKELNHKEMQYIRKLKSQKEI
ncbi:MAG: rRNA pseudouridine synthase [Clostridia bacterium]|nr:rRNA pseudouridine synthase [Clostridia bacterium]